MPFRLTSLLILTLAALATRLPMFGNPVIYTDEEFYLLVGSRILHGAIPYVDIWDRKPVGLFLLYAGMKALGGSGVLAYQIVGTGFVVATAAVVGRIARDVTGRFGTVCAGLAYILWLNLGHAGAGQSPIFYNLPMALAGLITLRAMLGEMRPFPNLTAAGAGAMLLTGLALQIKYSAVFEGIFFGLSFLWLSLRANGLPGALLRGLLWVLVALLPTLAALLTYVAMGHGQAFVFANFISIFKRSSDAGAGLLLYRLALMLAVLAPLLLAALWPGERANTARRFVLGWLAASLFGLLIFGTYLHHYLLPVLVPASAAAAGFFGQRRWRLATLGLLGVVFVISDGMMVTSLAHHGTQRQFDAIAHAIDPVGCLYVYSGEPAFYDATTACIPTRFAFPSHLSRLAEAHAVGADQTAEVARILATHPTTIMIGLPHWDENWAARRMVLAALAQDYGQALQAKLGRDPVSVYRLK
jgi:hypothetical protein